MFESSRLRSGSALGSRLLIPLDPLAFCASAGLSNPGTTKLPAVKPVDAKATATINLRNARIVFLLCKFRLA